MDSPHDDTQSLPEGIEALRALVLTMMLERDATRDERDALTLERDTLHATIIITACRGVKMDGLFVAPDAIQLSQVIAQATAPAFMLGAVAGFVSILVGRMNSVVDRIRYLNEIADDDGARGHLKSDIPRLRRRLSLLSSATRLALACGVCTSLLLCVGFGSAFLRLQHVYGLAGLFFGAVALMGVSLFKFGQEVTIGISEADHYR